MHHYTKMESAALIESTSVIFMFSALYLQRIYVFRICLLFCLKLTISKTIFMRNEMISQVFSWFYGVLCEN